MFSGRAAIADGVCCESEWQIACRSCSRPEAKGHDFFAFVKPGTSYVSLYLKPVYTWPDLLDDISPELRKRLQGSRTAFSFAVVDEALLAELETLVERAFRRYRKAGSGQVAAPPESPSTEAPA